MGICTWTHRCFNTELFTPGTDMEHHIHIHLHRGAAPTSDAGAFEESKHKREGGKFASGGGGAPAAPTGRVAFAAKHNPAARSARLGRKPVAEETEQEKLDRLRRESPLL